VENVVLQQTAEVLRKTFIIFIDGIMQDAA